MRKQIIIAALVLCVIGICHNCNNQQERISQSIDEIPGYIDDHQRQRIMMRGGEIAPDKMLVAREIVTQKTEKLLASDNQKDGGIRGWSTIGPCNIGGRVRAIALQPNIKTGENIYAGAAGGGLWRSTDGGYSYEVSNDIDLSLSISSIAVDPVDPKFIYVATGEGFVGAAGAPGAGIFRSTDGGLSFELLPSTQNDEFYWVNKVVVNPHNNSELYAVVLDANRDGGASIAGGILKKSQDFGETWTNVFTENSRLTDIEIHPNNSLVKVVAGHNSVRVLQGKIWVEKVSSATNDGSLPNLTGRFEIALSSDDQIMYALANFQDANGNGAVFRSNDGGDNWDFMGGRSDIFSGQFFGDYANTIMVDPHNEDVIYLGGVDMWKSEDAGVNFIKISTWEAHNGYTNSGQTENIQLHADQHVIIPSLLYSQNNKKVYVGNDGGFQKADNISIAANFNSTLSGWDNLTGNMCTVQFYGGAVSPNGKFAGGAQDNGILVKDNNNYALMDDWTHPQRGDGSKVYYRTEDSLFATTNYNQLLRSTDGGENFVLAFQLANVDTSLLIGPSYYNKSDPDVVYLGGSKLWVHDDNSNTQTILKESLTNNQLISSIDVSDDLIIVGYANGRLEFSQDGGSSWSGDITPATGGTIPANFITDIHLVFSGKTSKQYIITFGGYIDNNVLLLTIPVGHGHLGFNPISLGFDMQVNTVTTHPQNSNWLYLGTDVGIMASEDRGETWSVTPLMPNSNDVYNNESPFYVEVQELFWDYVESQGVYHLCAATYGRGIIRSDYVLHESCVDLTHSGAEYGTRARPYQTFESALGVAEDKGTPVIFLEGGDYKSPGQLWNKRVLIKSEASDGAVIKEF